MELGSGYAGPGAVKNSSGDLLVLPLCQFHFAFIECQGETLRASGTQPEMLNAAFIAQWKAKKSPAIQPHQHLGTLGIGALGNHESGSFAVPAKSLDVAGQERVALNREKHST